MKIGVNLSVLVGPYTGISRYTSSLYTHILKEDTSNEYIFFSHAAIVSGLVPEEIASRTKIFASPHYVPKSLQKVFFDLFAVKTMLDTYGIDIYHSPAYTLPLGPKRGRKYVVTFHDLIAFESIKLSGIFISMYLRIIILLSTKLADCIIADSQHTANDIIGRYPKHPPVEAIYLGIPDDYLTLDKHQDLDRGIDQRPYILAVSTHPYRKNINGILHAIGSGDFLKKHYDFVVVGAITDVQKRDILLLASHYQYADNVRLLENVSDRKLISLYQKAAVLVYPSFYEGFGLPIIEAMACGCPVITSNCSSMPELMPDQSWLVDPHNHHEIAQKTEALLRLDHDRRLSVIGKNADWAKRFTWSHSAKKTIRVFESL